jgi:hypothetical protein
VVTDAAAILAGTAQRVPEAAAAGTAVRARLGAAASAAVGAVVVAVVVTHATEEPHEPDDQQADVEHAEADHEDPSLGGHRRDGTAMEAASLEAESA